MLARGLGPGFNGPLLLVAQAPGQSAQTQLARLARELTAVPDVASVQAALVSASRDVSLLIPAIGAVMNVLTMGAAFAAIVLVFQHGFGSALLLAYQVFLVSRMHEDWAATGDNCRSVRAGQAHTCQVNAVAATIMCAVFAFGLGDPPRAVAVQPAAVCGQEDWPFGAFADGQVDRPCGARGEQDGEDLAALAGDDQGAVTALHAQGLDTGGGGFGDPQPVERQQGDQRVLDRRAERGTPPGAGTTPLRAA
jgi:hypothetical protein